MENKENNKKTEGKDKFGQKLSNHWPILMWAVFFDILGLIPLASVVTNFIFAGVLFIYFGPKKKLGGSEFTKIGIPVAVGSIFDAFLSILPVSVAAAVIRIALD
ncbi:MAG: hypothetical protein AAB491_02975 [Patescibacteria group bacterium]